MHTYGLIGKRLDYSFSKKYFTDKFEREQIADSKYELFELDKIEDFPRLIRSTPNLKGLNVTIPYKEWVMEHLDTLDLSASKIGAVNVVKFQKDGMLVGYNSDYIGFSKSLQNFLPRLSMKALILGTGGASRAIRVALEDMGIPFQLVSRKANPERGFIAYEDITGELFADHQLIINTTPLGTHPDIHEKPALPYGATHANHFFYDLVYNPETTAFMQQALDAGGKAKNGYEMLVLQAEASWDIWHQ